ncbi:hypothetical protein JCM3766R1_005820 [Sporobolomyces carnicolor]
MLASLLAPHITGRYDVTIVPIALPTPLVTSLLVHSPWITSDDDTNSETSIFHDLSSSSSSSTIPPDPGRGRRWCFVQIGQQISTGVGFVPFGLGRKTFYEAKLEIPYLQLGPLVRARTSSSRAETTETGTGTGTRSTREEEDETRQRQRQRGPPPPSFLTYKHTVLFSSHLMAFSSQQVSGLGNSHRVGFKVDDDRRGTYQAEGYLSVKPTATETTTTTTKWQVETIKDGFESWFVGSNTGSGATRFHTRDLEPPRVRPTLLHVRIHLPTLTGLDPDAVRRLVGNDNDNDNDRGERQGFDDDEGWYDVVGVEGWDLSVETTMEAKNLVDL